MVLHVYTFLGGLIDIEGIVVSNILFGLVIAQFYTYTHHWKRDPMWLKCLAVALVLAETTNTVFAQRVQYVHSVLVLDDPVDLTIVDWSISAMITFQLTSEILAQGFYVHRMWMISKNVPLTVVTVVLFTARIGLVLNCIIDTIKFDTWLELAVVSNFRPSTIASVALTIIHDGMIALTIVYSLRRERSSFRRTQGIVNWLVLYFVNTGAILVALGIVALISVVSDPLNLLFVGLYVVYAKALANAVFGALNARQYLRPKSAEVITFGDPATSRANTGIEACTKHHQMHVRVDRDILVA